MKSKTIINFAALVLYSTVSLHSIYGQTAEKTNSTKNTTSSRTVTTGKTVQMPALPNVQNGVNVSQKPESTVGEVNNSLAPKSAVLAIDSAKKETASPRSKPAWSAKA